MASRPLTADLTVTGQDQANLNRWMANVTDLIVELQTDHATFLTLTSELKVDVDLNAAGIEAAFTKMDSDTGIADTNYSALHGPGGSGTSIQAASITAADVATLSEATAPTLKRA